MTASSNRRSLDVPAVSDRGPAARTARTSQANGASRARTPQQIEADIEATRARLAATVDDLVDKAHPKNVARRGVRNLKAQVYDANGRLRTQKVAAIGAAVGVLGALVVLRKVVGRR